LADTAGATLNLNNFSQTIGSLAGGGTTGGNVTLGANATLTTGGNDTSTSYEGIISGTGTSGLTKTGNGTLSLNGTNTYTGITSISAGKLFINGSLSDTNVALTANSGATLGGTGTIGRNVTIATGGRLEFDLSTAAASHDRLDISSGRSFAFSGASTLTINASGGALPGIYTLITGGNNITGVAPATLNLPVGWAATVSISGNSLLLNVTSTSSGPGPVASFAISSIASTQTIGTPITGITLTAKDATNATATSFTGTVTFGGTGGFTGTSANFVAGVLSGVIVTPTVAGGNLTFTVNDGASHTGSTTITTIQTQYQFWAGGALFNQDANNDGVDNAMAWLLGAANPSENAAEKLPKATSNGPNLRLTFRCLKSTNRGGVQFKIQSSTDCGVTDPWADHEAAVPDADATVNGVVFDITDDGDYIHVIADIPAPGSGLFARLSGLVTP
jgi:autotransporter-associated beta strand protein